MSHLQKTCRNAHRDVTHRHKVKYCM